VSDEGVTYRDAFRELQAAYGRKERRMHKVIRERDEAQAELGVMARGYATARDLLARECDLTRDLRERVLVLEEALAILTARAEDVRGHYGIEECAGPGQRATEWDEVQDGLRNAARYARGVLGSDRRAEVKT
jgi:hypothetical protein